GEDCEGAQRAGGFRGTQQRFPARPVWLHAAHRTRFLRRSEWRVHRGIVAPRPALAPVLRLAPRITAPGRGEMPILSGGEGGIRTHAPLAQPPVFKAGAIDRSATSPFRSIRSLVLILSGRRQRFAPRSAAAGGVGRRL